MSRAERAQGVAAGILVIAVGLSVRYPITSISPLLGEIAAAYRLPASGIAVLSAIPVLLFGLASPLAPLLVSRLGLERAITVLLATLALATLLRPLSAPTLFAGTVLVGATIALLGILAPQIIRHALPHRGGFWTGIYTTSFGVSAAAGAAAAIPLFHLLGDRVAPALTAWGIPLLIALGLAIGFAPRLGLGRSAGPQRSAAPAESILRARGLWSVTGFFGCQALIYFSLTAWLPTIAVDRGMAPAQAGLLLAWLSIAGLPASLLAPTLAARPQLRTRLIAGIAVLSALGLVGLAFGPVALAPVMVAVLGVAQSAAFGIAIALIVFTAPSVAQTASFSAISQGVGYAVAATGPLLLGLLAQAGIPWSLILLMLTAASLGELWFGIVGSRASQEPTE
ncbi:MFS transporter [Leucobacter rhizosphaerae]|uniref:MFS transporter n=1 Tax=Leucobacter rhizosphaerae TaxID=2932245 RepID=A0ABY4FTH3_9MICO|nr:MFS transporter [Leucobacter rhizosphaerae]UOQ59601.1 MFS transporter [Leucobacter rhizosphaerae]